ncbi:MAG: hypothetical protein ACRDZM_07725 [Acidimicrobiia bacterium]
MKKLIGALSAASLIAVVMASGALASHVISGDTVAPNSNSHAFIAGNPACGAPAEGGINVKIESDVLAVGTFGPIDITYVDGTYFSWAINAAFLGTYDAGTIIVKGGPNAIEYTYSALANDPTNPAVAPGLPGIPAGGDAAGGPDDADYRLTSPLNDRNGKYYGISHIEFCFDPKA